MDVMTIRPKQGFASMSAERRREISRRGGTSVPRDKRPFAKDKMLARRAGAAGGHRRKQAQAPAE